MVESHGTRTLVLLRHAKSDWPPGIEDSARPLADRGRRDAPEAARWIAEHVGLPDLIITSPAQRTRQTVDLLIDEWSIPLATRLDDRVYEAEVGDLRCVVEDLPGEARRVLLVGHNPGLEEFAATWPTAADAEATRRLREKFPTSAIAVIEVLGDWGGVTSAVLRSVVVPRG